MITVKSAQRILRKMRRLELYFPVKMDLHRYVTETSLITLMQRNQLDLFQWIQKKIQKKEEPEERIYSTRFMILDQPV